jgi:hypothetical protein
MRYFRISDDGMDCFSKQAELRPSAAVTDKCPATVPSKDIETSPTLLNKTETGDSSYQTFCMDAFNAAIAPVYTIVMALYTGWRQTFKTYCHVIN